MLHIRHVRHIIPVVFGALVLCCIPHSRSRASMAPEEREKLAEAERQVAAGNSEKALQMLNELSAQSAQNYAVADVLFQVAQSQLDSGDYEQARTQFADLLRRFPDFHEKDLASWKLGICLLKLDDCTEGYSLLSQAASEQKSLRESENIQLLIEGAECAQKWRDAIFWQSEMAILDPDTALIRAYQQRAEEILDSKVSFHDVTKLAESLSVDNPLWPLVQYKLAKIYAHLRDTPRLLEALRKLQEDAPTSPWSMHARQMEDRIGKRQIVKPNAIGVVLPLSGRFQNYGQSVMAGIKLALQGSGIQLVVRDSVGEGAQARSAVASLVEDEQVIAIIGPILTSEAMDAATEAELLETPLLTLTRAENITETGEYVFRNMLTNSAQAKALADWAVQTQGLGKFAILYPSIPYGTELTTLFRQEVESRDAIVTRTATYEPDRTTFSNTIKKLVDEYRLIKGKGDYKERRAKIIKKEKNPYRRRKLLEALKKDLLPTIGFDALFIPDYHRNIGLIAPALAVEEINANTCMEVSKAISARQGKPIQLLGANGWNFPELVERGGKFVECSVFVDGFFINSEREETKAFVEAYREVHQGKDPSLLEASGYDSAKILRMILEDEKPTTRAAVKDALLKVRNFPGATGSTSFNAQREASKPLFLLTIVDGEIKELAEVPRS